MGIFLLIIMMMSVIGYYKFYHHHQNLPEGCDEFGYLQLADAFSRGVAFENHAKRDFSRSLIDSLEKNGFQYVDFAWMIAPHAYHMEKNTKKVINQYPPGTSYVLSFFDKENRQVYFPTITIFLFIVFPLIALLILGDKDGVNPFAVYYLIIFVLLAFVTSPFMLELHRINSIAPTYGLLLAAGILLKKRPGYALFLMGISIVFRIPNIIIAFPILLYFIFIPSSVEKYSYKTFCLRSVQGGVLLGIGGMSFYFFYVFLLLGNPLFPTYSSIDQEMVRISDLIENMAYYFDWNQKWFMANLIPFAVVLLLKGLKKIDWPYFFTLVSVALINYLFFLTHKVQIEYYPYASGLFLFGALIFILSSFRHKRGTHKFFIPFLSILLVGMLVKSVQDQKGDHRKRHSTQVKQYKTCFDRYDVVWAELRSSTVEYATGKAGFRYNWGPDKARQHTMQWLRQNAVRQAIMVDDLERSPETVNDFLKSSNLSYSIRQCQDFGAVYEINPQ